MEGACSLQGFTLIKERTMKISRSQQWMLHGSGILDQEGPISPEISPSPAVRTFNSIWLAYTVFAFFLHFISECKNRPFTH